MEDRKRELLERALREGIISPSFCEVKLDEPIPLWAALEMVLALMDKINPPGQCAD